MSKKSRRRNKKILAALALAGGAAMLAKGRGKGAMSGLTTVPDSQKEGFTRGDAVTNVVNPNLNKVAADTGTTVRKPPYGKMRGAGTDLEAIAAQNKRAALAQRGRIINPHEATAAAGAAYNPHQVIRGRINRNKGGRVTGIAKRGFGRALMKGKK